MQLLRAPGNLGHLRTFCMGKDGPAPSTQLTCQEMSVPTADRSVVPVLSGAICKSMVAIILELRDHR